MSDVPRIDSLADAVDAERAIELVLAPYGPDASLHVIDHAFRRVSRVGGASNPDEVELTGDLRRAVLSTENATIDGSTWWCIPERDQPVFLVCTPEGSAPAAAPDVAASGLVLRSHRHRFEDLDRQRRRADMSVAAELQWGLLPVRADTLGDWEIASVLEPAYDVAGDVYDQAISDGVVWAYALDGMGHGLDATITGVLALTAIRNARRRGASLVDQMAEADRLIFQKYGADRFVTGVGVRLDPDGSTQIVNAGHEPIRTVVGGRVRRLTLDAQLPLGVSADTTYTAQEGPTLGPGDAMVLLSDGPAGARDTDGSTWGSDRLDEAIERHHEGALLSVAHDVIDEVLDFVGAGPVTDDMTMVCIRRRPIPGTRDV